MDALGPNRAAMLASINAALKAANQHAKNQAGRQTDLFGGMDASDEDVTPQFAALAPLLEKDRLNFEKETLGYYVSGHPIVQYEEELKHLITCKIAHLRPKQKEAVLVAGHVMAIRTMNTKRGDRMAFVTINDQSASIEVAVFSNVYEEYRHIIEKDILLIVDGEASVDEYSGGYKISANKLMTIDEAREIYAKHLLIELQEQHCNAQTIETIKSILTQTEKGSCPVYLKYSQEKAQVIIPLDQSWRIKPVDDLLSQLKTKLPDNVIRMVWS